MSYETFPVELSDLVVEVLDPPAHGGAHHQYAVKHDDDVIATIAFQNGPIKDVGINGVTHETLLLIVAHRLRGYQSGPYVCDENRKALEHIDAAIEILYDRTRKRQDRGVLDTRQL